MLCRGNKCVGVRFGGRIWARCLCPSIIAAGLPSAELCTLLRKPHMQCAPEVRERPVESSRGWPLLQANHEKGRKGTDLYYKTPVDEPPCMHGCSWSMGQEVQGRLPRRRSAQVSVPRRKVSSHAPIVIASQSGPRPCPP